MNYKIADVVFDISYKYDYSRKLMQSYETEEPSAEKISLSDSEINLAKAKEPEYSIGYHESLCIFRKISKVLLTKYNGFLFHGSAIEFDKKGYIFTAPSGTGKTTHTKLWKEVFSDKVKIINGDKPLIRLVDGKFIIYGTPWMGKERFGENCKCELTSVAKIERAEKNEVFAISETEALKLLMSQTQIFYDRQTVNNLLSLMDELLKKVKFFTIRCNMEKEAAIVAKKGLIGE